MTVLGEPGCPIRSVDEPLVTGTYLLGGVCHKTPIPLHLHHDIDPPSAQPDFSNLGGLGRIGNGEIGIYTIADRLEERSIMTSKLLQPSAPYNGRQPPLHAPIAPLNFLEQHLG